MRVSQVMHTPAVTCGPHRTIQEVAQLMSDRRVGSVVIVDEVGELVGIATDRDIAVRGVAHGLSADAEVDRVMTRNVTTVAPATDLTEAAAIMVKRSIRRLPVVDELGRPHGLVSLDDVIRSVSLQVRELGDVVAAQAGRRSDH